MDLDLRSWALTDPGRLAVRLDGIDTSYRQLDAIANQTGRITRPKEIRLLESLPMSPQGKLLRRELRRLLPEPAHD